MTKVKLGWIKHEQNTTHTLVDVCVSRTRKEKRKKKTPYHHKITKLKPQM
ncbi:hypothetical protein HanRHA438_Chr17g0798431 [Helianthus annuus]|nr:hypothetical protein HanPSC8_Chr17g0756021 [Helianthus annuus]KAJ0824998.1 hypothetical protein HanRHA438_Chr17g0798431 [Helianthus annuus]